MISNELKGDRFNRKVTEGVAKGTEVIAKKAADKFKEELKDALNTRGTPQRGSAPRRVSGDLYRSIDVKNSHSGTQITMHIEGEWYGGYWDENGFPFINAAWEQVDLEALAKEELTKQLKATFRSI